MLGDVRRLPHLRCGFPETETGMGNTTPFWLPKSRDPTGSHLGGRLMDAEELHPTHALVSPWLSIWGLIPLLRGYVRLVRGCSRLPSP